MILSPEKIYLIICMFAKLETLPGSVKGKVRMDRRICIFLIY